MPLLSGMTKMHVTGPMKYLACRSDTFCAESVITNAPKMHFRGLLQVGKAKAHHINNPDYRIYVSKKYRTGFFFALCGMWKSPACLSPLARINIGLDFSSRKMLSIFLAGKIF